MMTEHQRDTLGMLRLALKSAEVEVNKVVENQGVIPAIFQPTQPVQRDLIPHWANIETLQGIPDARDSSSVVLVLARLLKHMPNGAAELRAILMTLASYAPHGHDDPADLSYPIDTFEDIPTLLLKFYEIRGLQNFVERQWTMEAIQRTKDDKTIVKANMLSDIYDKKNPKVLGRTSGLVAPGVYTHVHQGVPGQTLTLTGAGGNPGSLLTAAAGIGGGGGMGGGGTMHVTSGYAQVGYPNGGGYNPPMGAQAMNSEGSKLIDMPEDFDLLANTITEKWRSKFGIVRPPSIEVTSSVVPPGKL